MHRKVIVVLSLILLAAFWLWIRPRPASESATRLSILAKQGEETQSSETPGKAPTSETKSKANPKTQPPQPTPAKPIPFPKHTGGHTGADAKPMDRYKNFSFGETLEINERSQKVLGARAVPKENYLPYMGEIAFRHEGYVVMAVNPSITPNWKSLVVGGKDRPVVVNPGNGRPGIVTGTLVIKFADIRQAEVLAGRENLQLLKIQENIGVAFFRAPEYYELGPAINRLQQIPGVQRVELEILQSRKGAW